MKIKPSKFSSPAFLRKFCLQNLPIIWYTAYKNKHRKKRCLKIKSFLIPLYCNNSSLQLDQVAPHIYQISIVLNNVRSRAVIIIHSV